MLWETNMGAPWLLPTELLCASGCSGCCSQGDGDPTSVRVGVGSSALLGEDHIGMCLQTALPKHLLFQTASSSCIPCGSSVLGLGQLWDKLFLQQSTRWAELYWAQCRIPRLLLLHRGLAMCVELGWLLGLSMTSAFLLCVRCSLRGLQESCES